MALLATQQITPSGTTPTYGAVSASDTFRPGPNVFLHVKNAGGSADTVVVDDKNSVGPPGALQFNPDLSVSVPATTGDKLIGPLTADRYADATTGLGTVTHSFTTSVTCALLAI